jgi:hypothetical protein
VIVVASKEVAMAGRKINDAADARACMRAMAARGVNRADWAREHGIDGRSLNAWRINLGHRGNPPESRPARPRVVELVATAAIESEPVRFVVRCGALVVEVDPRFDEQALRRLLRVVASC